MAYVPPLNGGRINASISGNTAGAGALISTGTMVLAGGNNVTLSQNGNSISIVGGGGSINLSAGANSANLASVTFANSNGVSFGLSNGTLTGSVAAQSAQTLGLYATGANTVGLSSSGTLDARSLNISGQGALSAGLSGSTLQLAAPAVSGVNAAGIVNISSNGSNVTISAPAFSAGIATNSTVSNQLILAGGNNITLSQSVNASGATVSIAGGGGGVALEAGGGTFSSGSLSLNAAGALSINSGAGPNLTLSAPAQSYLMATGAINLSTNGNTISIGAPGVPISHWENQTDVFTSLATMGQGSLSLQRMILPLALVASAAKIGGSVTANTSAGNATGSANISLQMGVYSLTGSTLSLVTSGSALNAFSWQANSSVSGALSSITGMRQLTVPLNASLAPGEYWIGALASSATTSPGAAFTLYGNNLMPSGAGASQLAPIGSNTSAAPDLIPFQGIYTAATAALPNSIVGSNINNTSAAYLQRANFYNAIYSATY